MTISTRILFVACSVGIGVFLFGVGQVSPDFVPAVIGLFGLTIGGTLLAAYLFQMRHRIPRQGFQQRKQNIPSLPLPTAQPHVPPPPQPVIHARVADQVVMRQHKPAQQQQKPVSPGVPRTDILITWHPEIEQELKTRYASHLDWTEIEPSAAPVQYIVTMIARAIQSPAVRIARSEQDRDTHVVALVIFLVGKPLSSVQKEKLGSHFVWMQEIAYGTQLAVIAVIGKRKHNDARMPSLDTLDTPVVSRTDISVSRGTTVPGDVPVVEPVRRDHDDRDCGTYIKPITTKPATPNTPINLCDDSPVATRELVRVRHIHEYRADERQQTIIVGASGDGKTQTSLAMMVMDIARGCQVVWCNPDLALYHPADQPTDIRRLRHHFEQVSAYDAIQTAINTAVLIINQRKPLYQDGLDVGHPVVIYLDEYPSITAECRGISDQIARIAREGRKVRVWLVLATQDAQVETLKFHGGVRNTFHTRLLGNVDDASWRALGGGTKQNVDRGWWHCFGKIAGIQSITLPPEQAITRIAQMPAKRFPFLANSLYSEQEPITADTYLATTDVPDCTDDALIAWYFRQVQAGEKPSLNKAMSHFGITKNQGTLLRMKDMFSRNGLECEHKS